MDKQTQSWGVPTNKPTPASTTPCENCGREYGSHYHGLAGDLAICVDGSPLLGSEFRAASFPPQTELYHINENEIIGEASAEDIASVLGISDRCGCEGGNQSVTRCASCLSHILGLALEELKRLGVHDVINT